MVDRHAGYDLPDVDLMTAQVQFDRASHLRVEGRQDLLGQFDEGYCQAAVAAKLIPPATPPTTTTFIVGTCSAARAGCPPSGGPRAHRTRSR
jgi:hypothetical protein